MFFILIAVSLLSVTQDGHALSAPEKAESFLYSFSRLAPTGLRGYVVWESDASVVLKTELENLFQRYINICPELVKHIVNIFRANGVFLEAYRIKNKNSLSKIKSPFIFFLEKEGFCFTQENNTEKQQINYLGYKGTNGKIKWQRFLDLTEGIIFSFPIENIMFERIKETAESVQGKFVAIYTHHKYSDIEMVKATIEQLRREAANKKWRILYIDELGLIPYDTIANYMKINNLSEKDAFERVKATIKKEAENLGRGYAIYDSLPFYNQLYSYLAEIKMHSTIEDLDYELWKRIVAYDEEKQYLKAIEFFALTEFEEYIKKLREYTVYFYIYNIKKRDEMFVKQIEDLAEANPNTLIFTIRGLGHYGIENNINNINWPIEVLIVSEGPIYESFNRRSWLQALWSNKIVISSQRETVELAKSYIQDVVLFNLQRKEKLDFMSARRLSYKATCYIGLEELKELFQVIELHKLLGFIRDASDLDIMRDIIYDWLINRDLLKFQ